MGAPACVLSYTNLQKTRNKFLEWHDFNDIACLWPYSRQVNNPQPSDVLSTAPTSTPTAYSSRLVPAYSKATWPVRFSQPTGVVTRTSGSPYNPFTFPEDALLSLLMFLVVYLDLLKYYVYTVHRVLPIWFALLQSENVVAVFVVLFYSLCCTLWYQWSSYVKQMKKEKKTYLKILSSFSMHGGIKTTRKHIWRLEPTFNTTAVLRDLGREKIKCIKWFKGRMNSTIISGGAPQIRLWLVTVCWFWKPIEGVDWACNLVCYSLIQWLK